MPKYLKVLDWLLPARWLRPLMFIMVCVVLYIHIPPAGSRPPYAEFEEGLKRTYRWHVRDNDDFYKEMLYDSLDIRPDTVLKDVRHIRARTADILKYLQGFKQKKLNTNAVDSLQQCIDDYCLFLGSRYHDVGYMYSLAYYAPIFSFCTHNKGAERGQYKIGEILHDISLRESGLILSALQNMILMSEMHITRIIYYSSIPGCDLLVYSYQCIAVPAVSFLLPGQKVIANLSLMDHNKALVPKVQTDKGRIDEIENGVARWSRRSSLLGTQMISGSVEVKLKDQVIRRPWSFQYMVIAKGASMDLDNANICYAGIANPMSISVPGYRPDALSLKVAGAKVNRVAPGNYEIIPDGSKRQMYAYVDAKNADGVISTVAGRELYVHEAPAPLAYVPGAADGKIAINQIDDLTARQTEDIDLSYKIGTYTLILIRGNEVLGTETSGSVDAASMLNNARAGDKLIYADIEVTGSNGRKYQPASVSYILK